MYLADLSLARVALDLGKLLAAAAVGAGVVAMLRKGRQLRLLGQSLANARCTMVSKEPYNYPVVVADDAVPFAFCGGIIRPHIYFSTGLARLLTAEELNAVLAHEEVHARRRDPLRVLIAHTVAAALFPIPLSRALRDRYLACIEVSADAEVVNRLGATSLAGALLKLIQHSSIRSSPSSGPLINPFNATEERIKRLLGSGGASHLKVAPPRHLLATGVMVASAGLMVPVMVYSVSAFFKVAPLCEVTLSAL